MSIVTEPKTSIKNVDTILVTARKTFGYAEKLLAGIDPVAAARFPRFGSGANQTVINTNHPVFVYGHLAVYPSRMLEIVGMDASAVKPNETYAKLFPAGVECVDDMAGNVYPSLHEVAENCMKWNTLAMDKLAGLSDEAFNAENTNERSRESFPRIGILLTFLLNNHPMMHLGQVSAWRRCFGMPAAM